MLPQNNSSNYAFPKKDQHAQINHYLDSPRHPKAAGRVNLSDHLNVIAFLGGLGAPTWWLRIHLKCCMPSKTHGMPPSDKHCCGQASSNVPSGRRQSGSGCLRWVPFSMACTAGTGPAMEPLHYALGTHHEFGGTQYRCSSFQKPSRSAGVHPSCRPHCSITNGRVPPTKQQNGVRTSKVFALFIKQALLDNDRHDTYLRTVESSLT